MKRDGLRRILFVDDEADIREIVQIALELTPQFLLQTAESGQRALQLMAESPPDLVLLDVQMPQLDGPATLRRMRAEEKLAHIPVIFVTAKAMPRESSAYLAMGAAGVIPKPFDPYRLAEQIFGMWERV